MKYIIPISIRAILEAELPGGGGGGCSRSRSWIAAKIFIQVECDVNYNTLLLDYSLLLSFILYELIMLIYAKNKSYFHYKSLIKLQDC